eukprot:COSAG02_NODE_27571_length_606_cov_1.706114_1_plen_24_part_01
MVLHFKMHVHTVQSSRLGGLGING